MVSQRTERLYLIVVLWLLRTELIAWKAQNCKPTFTILLVQPLKFFILAGKPATTGNIDDQQYRSTILFEGNLFAIDAYSSLVVNGTGIQ